jgi:hypothetical protein
MLAFVPAPVHHVYPAALVPPFSYPRQQPDLADYILAQAARKAAILRNEGHAYQRDPLALLDDITLAELAAQNHRIRARRLQEEADRRRQREQELYMYALRLHHQQALERAAWTRQQQLQRLAAETEAREHLRRQELARRKEAELFRLEAEWERFIQAFQAAVHHPQPSEHAVSHFPSGHLPPILTCFASAWSRQTGCASPCVP